MKVLVAYASRHGATRGIAERIAQTLTGDGLGVELKSVAEADAIEGYDAFVVGSAAYMGGWLGEATSFVRRHQAALAARPTWLFSSGPVGTDKVDAKGRDQLNAAIPKEFAEFGGAIQPRDEKVFYGAYDPDAAPAGVADRVMSGFLRLMPAVRSALPAGDFRDWPKIEAWAHGIAESLTSDRKPVAAAG